MSDGANWGIHDNTYSWLIRGFGNSARSCKIGGETAEFSLGFDRMVVFANGVNTGGGYAYYNQNNTLGTASDERLKKDFKAITPQQSLAFLKALEPTSFCLKEQKPCTKEKADGTEEVVTPEVCTCRQDGWVAQNVLQACEISGASKTVINHWYDYEQELKLPEEERKTLLGVSDRPILSHTVNVVKVLMERVEVLEARNIILEQSARHQEKAFNEYKALTDSKIEKLANLLSQLIK
jgi:hypothetical protein